MLNDKELLRYSRQLLLPNFGIEGQLALKQARVLILGSGGLGCPAALYLGSAGVGTLVLADDDEVELPNLQRQIAFTQEDLGLAKAETLAKRLRSINPEISVLPRVERLDDQLLAEIATGVDLALDCTDNFETRFALNRACVQAKIPLVSGAAIRGEGQVSVFDARDESSPCYHCLYPEQGNENLTCSEAGVIGPLVGIIGATQAMEAIKLISGQGRNLAGRLMLLDAWQMEWREMKLARDPDCPVCSF